MDGGNFTPYSYISNIIMSSMLEIVKKPIEKQREYAHNISELNADIIVDTLIHEFSNDLATIVINTIERNGVNLKQYEVVKNEWNDILNKSIKEYFKNI